MEIDFSDINPDDFEAGGAVRPGWYRCTVNETKDSQYAAGNVDVEFLVTHGPFRGCKIFDTIIEPSNAADTDKAKKCVNRIGMYLTRLGLFTKEELKGRQVVIDWSQLVGRECLVEVKEDSWTKDDGEKKTKVKVTFDGVHALDGDKVPDDVLKKYGLTRKPKAKDGDQGEAGHAAASTPKGPQGGTGAAKRKVDTSKL
jgi:hypothetical protein